MTERSENEAENLRATSDGLVLAINEVSARERLKRGVSPADPAFVELARDVRVAAEILLELARREEATAEETGRGSMVDELPPIEAVEPGRELGSILAEWRAVEQRLAAATPGSQEARDLMVEFQRMRDRYRQAVDDKLRKE